MQRAGLTSRYTVQPELDAKGDGHLGLHLASNLKYKHTKATSIPDAALRANSALVGCFSQVTSGESLCEHFQALKSCWACTWLAT